MGDQSNNQQQAQPQTRSGTSFSRDIAPSASPPPVSTTLPGQPSDTLSSIGQTWDTYVVHPFNDYVAKPFNDYVVEPIDRHVVTPIIDNVIRPLWNFAEQAVEGIAGHPYAEARGRRHLGVDIACPVGTPVRALGDCRVIRAHEQTGYGPLVVVDYGHGILGAYAHNSSIEVSPGQVLEQGDLLSLSGNRGTSSGPHVHEEMLVRGSDGRFYACAPEEVRELAASGGLNTQEQRDTFIDEQADKYWNGNKDRMVPLMDANYQADMQRFAFNATPDRAVADNGPAAPAPVG